MRRFLSLITVLISLVVISPLPWEKVHAQAYSAADLINTVNEMRASYGLAPYQVDGSLTSIAQGHSDYMASIGTLTHTRADGSSPAGYGITAENIGGGKNASPAYIVYTQWADDLHTNTVVGYTEGLAGAGVAEKDGILYYTLDVRNTGKVNNYQPTAVAGTPASTLAGGKSPQNVISPFQTVTPLPDGSIIHEIQAGQTLWHVANAYGLTVPDLVGLNSGLSADNPIVYPGQKIIVRRAFTATPSLIPSLTPIPPTRTPRPTFTPRPTHTITTSPTPTSPGFLPDIPSLGSKDTRVLGIGVVAVSVLGLLAILITTLRSRGKNGDE